MLSSQVVPRCLPTGNDGLEKYFRFRFNEGNQIAVIVDIDNEKALPLIYKMIVQRVPFGNRKEIVSMQSTRKERREIEFKCTRRFRYASGDFFLFALHIVHPPRVYLLCWDKVTPIVRGATAGLVGGDEKNIRKWIKKARDAGVYISACKACPDRSGVTEALDKLQIEAEYRGSPLAEVLEGNEKLPTS